MSFLKDDEVLAVALNDMFHGKSSFYVTDVESMAKMMGVIIPSHTRAQMACLHCVSYSDMPKDVLNDLKMTVAGLFSDTLRITWTKGRVRPKGTLLRMVS